jgi:hypothetical protein
MTSLTFLTRESCVNTDTMRANLDAALRVIGLPADYAVIDADRLPTSDPRRRYGTPTVLVGNRDLFSMPEARVSERPPT